MKFIHLGDLHLGKSLSDFDLIEDQEYILKQIVSIAEEKKIDGVIIAGDVYDKTVPSEAAVRLLDSFLATLSDKSIKVYIISGNHDSDERLNFGRSFFESHGVYISSKYNGEIEKCVVMDEYGSLNIYLMPFIKASQVRRFYPNEVIENYDDAIKVAIENTDINENERNIMVAHQFVIGGNVSKCNGVNINADNDNNYVEPILAGSEGASVKSVGLIEKISTSRFEVFDYVALGHIHSAQRVGKDTVRYSGSPLKYSLSEANNDKTITIVNMNEKGNVEIELIKLKPMRDLRHIKGKMKTLLQKENIVNEDDFIYITLTDEEKIDNVMGIFKQYYKNTVKIDYDNKHSKEMKNIDFSIENEVKSFEEIVSEFYSKMYGIDISSEEMGIMLSVAREVGVVNEAD